MSRFGPEKRDRSGSTRARRLKLYPFCARCEAQGIVRLTAIIDRKTPLAFGVPDTDENCQGLCAMHDAIKTAGEQTSQRGASTHPEWLERARCEVVIVSGPPCGGKSTYVRENAKPEDIIIDMDEIAAALDPSWERRWNAKLLDHAMRVRNAMLGELKFRPARSRAWFIVSAPTAGERLWWRRKLGGAGVMCQPLQAVCIERARARAGRYDHVQRWFAEAPKPWSPPSQRRLPRVAFDADGYPVQ